MTRPIPNLVGMVHLLALPGSPGYGGSMEDVIETARSDATILADAGFPALLVENFRDVPYYADSVPAETVAAMTLAVGAVSQAGVTVGVNVLRNDAMAALGIAAATSCSFIRVNVLTGVMYADQGPLTGRAADVLRRRSTLAPEVEIWADVMVKHATAPAGADARQAASDTVERGLADAVIVSGSGTGAEPDLQVASIVKDAVPAGTRVVIGSGATGDNLDRLLSVADTIIVGSAIKVAGEAGNRPDPVRAADFAQMAAERGLK